MARTKVTLVDERDYDEDNYGKKYSDDDYWDDGKGVKEKCLL